MLDIWKDVANAQQITGPGCLHSSPEFKPIIRGPFIAANIHVRPHPPLHQERECTNNSNITHAPDRTLNTECYNITKLKYSTDVTIRTR